MADAIEDRVVTMPKDDVHTSGLPGAVLGLPIQLSLEGIGTFRSHLIGMEAGGCLIVKLPPIADIVTKLYQKNHVIVRYFHSGNVYGFRSTLIGIIKDPVRLFILAYPEQVDSLNVRKDERYVCMIPARVRIQSGLDLQGFISDISAGGCKFECALGDAADRPRIEIGQPADLSFQLPADKVWRKLQTEIRILKMDAVKLSVGLRYKPDETQQDQMQALNDIPAFIDSLSLSCLPLPVG